MADAGNPERAASFEFEGKTWTVRALGPEARLHFERWLEAGALQVVVRNRTALGELAFPVALAAVVRSVECGVYSWGGPVAVEMHFLAHGVRKLAYLATAQVDGQGTLTPENFGEMWEKCEEGITRAYYVAAGLMDKSGPEQANAQPVPRPAGNYRPGFSGN